MLKEEESYHEAFFPGGGFRLDFLLTAYGVLRMFFRNGCDNNSLRLH